MENRALWADTETVFWHPQLDGGVLPVEARSARMRGPDVFDVEHLHCPATFLTTRDGHELVLIGTGRCRIRLLVTSGTLRWGPATLRYSLEGLQSIKTKTLTLQRLIMLARLRRMPVSLFPKLAKASRWLDCIRMLDAMKVGISQHQFAIAEHGEKRVRDEWYDGSETMRQYIHRLQMTAKEMARSGWRRLLK